jgi:hypothetical protein
MGLNMMLRHLVLNSTSKKKIWRFEDEARIFATPTAETLAEKR